VPEGGPSATPAAVFSIEPGASFLDVLAHALVARELVPPSGLAPELELADTTVFLPTRRAARALGEAIHRAAGRAVLLPRVAGLGEAGEDESPFAFARDGEGGEEVPAGIVVSEAERRAVLADIAIEWSRTTTTWTDRPPVIGPEPVPRTPVEAAAFAIELARLMDEMTMAGASREKLAGLVPEARAELSRNWAINLEFLTHAIDRWHMHLERRGLVERVVRRDASLLGLARRLENEGSPAPVIAAGSTGSVPAAAALMGAIARVGNGAVVLPGLDCGLDDRAWAALGPEHPQFGMKQLIETIGIGRADVRRLAGGPAPARAGLVREVMRPAATAERWVDWLAGLDGDAQGAALRGVSLIEPADEHEEARVIALILRRAAEAETGLTALVTPDRSIARRVSGELARWQMTVDDSAGQPLAATVPGVFLRLIAAAAASRFAPVATLALLKHPLARLGLGAAAARHAARVIELSAMRGARPPPGLEGIGLGLRQAARRVRRHPVTDRLGAAELAAAHDLLARLTDAFAPLAGMIGGTAPVPASGLLAAHIEAAEAVARMPDGEPGGLWAGTAGEALAAFAAEAIAAARHAGPLGLADFGGWIDRLMQGRVVRPPASGPANIVIWGPLEARLQHVDRLVLAGLNEGVWPGESETDPWLGRQMRSALGLDAPERRIGLQAHDVAQALHSDRVVLVRSHKRDGTPAVPSRWLWRLKTLLAAAGLADALEPDDAWIGWARSLDAVARAVPCAPPRPSPPVASRPARLSVTRIETLLRDPYAIYARFVLALAPLDDLEMAPDATDYGSIIHAALGRLIAEFPVAPLPEGALARLFEIGRAEFAALDDRPGLKAYWMLRFGRVARWFVDADAALRASGTASHVEISGALDPFAEGSGHFTLTARADRVDVAPGQGVTIIDYKTGRPPSDKQVGSLLAPQLPLEAAILAGGGFAGLGGTSAAGLAYMSLGGREPAGEVHYLPGRAANLAAEALGKLRGLVAAYADPRQPYLSRRIPWREDAAGEYDHLARVGEWSVGLGRRHAG
jgi:ATP-dependent helicase/nuclease subunit B